MNSPFGGGRRINLPLPFGASGPPPKTRKGSITREVPKEDKPIPLGMTRESSNPSFNLRLQRCSIDHGDGESATEDENLSNSFSKFPSLDDKKITPQLLRPTISDNKQPLNRRGSTSLITGTRTQVEITLIRKYPNLLREISDFEFDAIIGKGGFGEVWKANDLRSGKVVAVKELFTTTLSGRHLVIFIREINTMAICKDRYIVPFVGYSIEPPFSIITEFMPCDNLYHSTNRRKRTQVLSGTHLTIIAICIAHGMLAIHKAGVIHRDLKTSNILMDPNGFPRISDFGIARFLSGEKNTVGIGTVNHMAPETFKSGNYDFKCDIFSFGILLYEMSEGRQPYRKSMSTDDIIKFVCGGGRPNFRPKVTPQALKDFIGKCWDQDPKKRPDFYEIYQTLCSGKVLFAGADSKKVKKFGNQLHQDDLKRMNQIKPINEVPSADINATIARLKRSGIKKGPLRPSNAEECMDSAEKSNDPDPEIRFDSLYDQNQEEEEEEKMPKPLPVDFPLESMLNEINPKYTSFEQKLKNVTDIITPGAFDIFFDKISPMLRTNEKIDLIILNSIYDLAKRNHHFIDQIQQTHMFSIIVFEDYLADIIFDIFSLLVSYRPNTIFQNNFRALKFLMYKRTARSVYILYKYYEKLDTINDPFPFLDLFLKYAKIYKNVPTGQQFIDIIYRLCIEFPEFHSERFHQIRPILTVFTRSKNKNVVISALKATTFLYDAFFKLDYITLVNCLYDNTLYPYALSLLKRVSILPTSKTLCRAIIHRSLKTPSAYVVLLKYAGQSFECAKIVSDKRKWLNVPSDSEGFHTVVQILMTLYQHHDLRSKLLQYKCTMGVFNGLLIHKNEDYLDVLDALIEKSTFSEAMVNELNRNGFLENLNNAAIEGRELGTLTNIISNLVKSGPFLAFMRLSNYFLTSFRLRNQYTKSSIHVVAELSRNPEIAQQCKNPKIIKYFSSLAEFPEFKDDAELFLKNVGSEE